jgi:hypothetical protein
MNYPHQRNTNSPIQMVDNHMQNSSTTTSWEVLCDDFHPNIDLLRQLEQSMQFHDLNDDDDEGDDYSQQDDDNHESGRQGIHQKKSMYHNSTNVAHIPEIVSPEQSLWKIRFLRLVRCCCCCVLSSFFHRKDVISNEGLLSLPVTHDIYFSSLFAKIYTDCFQCNHRRSCGGLQCGAICNSRQQQIVVACTNDFKYIAILHHDIVLFGIPYLQLSRTRNQC